MAKIFKSFDKPNRLNTILMVIGIVVTLIIVISTALAIIVHISNVQSAAPASSEPSVTYRKLDEFADDDSRLAYAASLLDQRLYRAAEAFLSEFLSIVEADSRLSIAIRYNRGLAHLYLQEYDQAITDFSAVTALADYPDAYYNLGNALVGLHQYEKALEAYDSALELEQKPEYIKVRDAVLAVLG